LPGWARVYLTIVGILAPLLMGWLARKRGQWCNEG
jgi:hypothetical protein